MKFRLAVSVLLLITDTAALIMSPAAKTSMQSDKSRLAILSSGYARSLSMIDDRISTWIENLEETFHLSVDIFFVFNQHDNDVEADINSTVWHGHLAKWTRAVQFKHYSFCEQNKYGEAAEIAANMFKGVKDAWRLAQFHENQTGNRYDYTIRYRHDLLCSDAKSMLETFGMNELFGEEVNPQIEQMFAGAARPNTQYQYRFAFQDTFWITTRALSEQAFTVFDDLVDDHGACKIDRSFIPENCRMDAEAMFFECLIDTHLGDRSPNATFLRNRHPWAAFECRIVRKWDKHWADEEGLVFMPLDFDDHM